MDSIQFSPQNRFKGENRFANVVRAATAKRKLLSIEPSRAEDMFS
jgi:hypothetical protein